MSEAHRRSGLDLSSRELIVLHMLADGRSDEDIEEALGVPEDRVAETILQILAVFSAESREQAIVRAIEEGLLGPAGPGFRIVDRSDNAET